MSWRNIGIVYRKELTDSLRDRRTLISMVVVPIVIMPLMSIGLITLAVVMVGKAEKEVPKVMIVGGEDSPQVVADLKAMKDIDFEPGTLDYAQLISDKKIRAAVDIPPGFDAAVGHGADATVKIYNYENDLKSGIASAKLQKRLGELKDRTVKDRLVSRSLPVNLVDPFEVKTENVAPPEKVGGAVLGGFLPYFVIILCMTGAMYPAIDLTAGEKERGTIETILCSPVSRTHLVLGKFLMVLTASLCTAILAMTSMGVSFGAVKKYMAVTIISKADNPLNFTIGFKAISAVFLMVLPLAVLFSAALLAIALTAKSYKEAQSYLSPLVIVVVIPAVAALMPGVEINTRMLLIPVLNTSLVCKDIVSGTYHWNNIATIFISSCVYATVALFIAVKLFQREDVLFRT
jgi:sodium transport system permease protein